MNFTLVFLLLGLSSIFGEKCVVYKDYGSIPSLPKGAFYERYCRSVGGSEKQYCVEWDCPKTDCSYPIVPETGCPYCRGTCISQGKVQREGNSFRCADGCNTCTCHTSTIAMCYNRYPPKECRGYNEGKRDTLRKILGE
ncbi:kielin/chordin-like protein [Mytilus trossulus]|uniref:kielin/chordin-like protein n=1 Tax=Mytilus trossulus TaxID=6551 RepID=UPI0030041F03